MRQVRRPYVPVHGPHRHTRERRRQKRFPIFVVITRCNPNPKQRNPARWDRDISNLRFLLQHISYERSNSPSTLSHHTVLLCFKTVCSDHAIPDNPPATIVWVSISVPANWVR